VFPKIRESVKRRDRKIVEKKVRMAPFFPGSTKKMMQTSIVQRDRVTIRDGRKFFSFWDTLFFIFRKTTSIGCPLFPIPEEWPSTNLS